MFRKIRNLSLCMALAFAATSCIIEERELDPDKGESTVRFTLSVPGAVRPTYTRTVSEAHESDIATLNILVFSAANNYSGKFVIRGEARMVGTDGRTWEVDLPEGTYDMMILGNINYLLNRITLTPQATTWNDMTTGMVASNGTDAAKGGKWTDDTEHFSFFGGVQNVTIDGNTSLSTVAMHRSIARIDLRLSAMAASGSETGTDNSNFALKEVFLCNFNTQGLVYPFIDAAHWNATGSTTNPGQGVAAAPSLPANPRARTGMDNALKFDANDGEGFTESGVTREIYTYEAEGGDASTRATNPCLVFGGSYKGGATTYYRVDFISKQDGRDVYLDLLRNHLYEVTVNKISGAGYATPQQAFDAVSSQIEINVLQWNEADLAGVDVTGQTYRITTTDDGRGAAVANYSVALPGMPVRIAATPAKNYMFRRWVVVSGSPTGLNATDNPATFTMPAENVELRAEFAAAPIPLGTENGRITMGADGRYRLTTDPHDAGLFFCFGSVVGIYSADGRNQTLPDSSVDLFDAIDVAWSPVEINSWTGIPQYDKASYDAGIRETSAESGYHTVGAVKAGQGDPCRLVGLDLDKIYDTPADQLQYSDVDNGTWRMPTMEENRLFVGKGYNDGTDTNLHYTVLDGVNGGMFPYAATGDVNTFLPFAQLRGANGATYSPGSNDINVGEYLSSTVAKPDKMLRVNTLKFFQGYLSYFHYGGEGYGYSVRCVRQAGAPPVNEVMTPNGNTNVAKPTAGVIAPPGVLGVGARSGRLTIQGSREYAVDPDLKNYADAEFGGLAPETVYTAVFKWGSLVGLSNSTNNDAWDGTSDVIWAPREYDLSKITAEWVTVPYASNGVFPADQPAAALGDPCSHAAVGTSGKAWVMPSGNPYNGIEYTASTLPAVTIAGVNGRRAAADKRMFFPFAGFRNYDTGKSLQESTYFNYWTSTPAGNMTEGNINYTVSYKMYGQKDQAKDLALPDGCDIGARAVYAFAIRCVPTHDRPRELTIGNVVWAGSNLQADGTFAPYATGYGSYFAWNSRVGYTYNGNPVPPATGSASDVWEAANNPCPAPWRLPTHEELEALIANTTSKWETVNGVSGMRYSINSNGESIFLPAAGHRNVDVPYNRGIFAVYWTPSTTEGLQHLRGSADKGNEVHYGGIREHLYSIRCVRDK